MSSIWMRSDISDYLIYSVTVKQRKRDRENWKKEKRAETHFPPRPNKSSFLCDSLLH